MGTSKWNALNHVVDALRNLGSVEYLDAGVYENARKIFKKTYTRSTRRRQTVVVEVLACISVIGRLETFQDV